MLGHSLAEALAFALADIPIHDDHRVQALAEWVYLALPELRADRPDIPESVHLDYLTSVARLAAFHVGIIASLRSPAAGHA